MRMRVLLLGEFPHVHAGPKCRVCWWVKRQRRKRFRALGRFVRLSQQMGLYDEQPVTRLTDDSRI